MLRNALLFLAALACAALAHAQQDAPYFQQNVAYDIEVRLDDSLHKLIGYIDIDYTNNSPDELSEIYMHLWPNAYMRRSTAFARQQLRMGSSEFHFADAYDLGGLREIDFLVDGEDVPFDYLDKDTPDVAIIRLKRPLPPGGSLRISTPFTLVIPASFSRLGHVGQSYQITQWYPKPAVYDREGWHPMPYLDMGEFYSEYGSFRVRITLPDNYVVGATGELLTASERQFLLEKSEAPLPPGDMDTEEEGSEPFPASSRTMKTLEYRAERVHDFAWFADKRFRVRRSEQVLASGKKVETWAMFTAFEADLWANATDYVNRSLAFYSDQLGEYPYGQATAVQSALSAGGGMEYPMITVIGAAGSAFDLERVIMHEVGHNWFYGILGSDERRYPWMDEGLNSFYELRYVETYFKDYNYLGPPIIGTVLGLPAGELNRLPWRYQARLGQMQAIDTPSDELSDLNYWLCGYLGPALAFRHLEAYLGRPAFERAMRRYFAEWQFKHPQPADLRAIFEAESARDLAWFFDGVIGSEARLDYQLRSAKASGPGWTLRVRNQGGIAAPFLLAAFDRQGELLSSQWVQGFEGEQDIAVLAPGEAHHFQIDPDALMLEFDVRDNYAKAGGLFPTMPPLQARPFIVADQAGRSEWALSPVLGYNIYDGFMLGLGSYNSLGGPIKPFEFAHATMIGFREGALAGSADVRYNILPDKGWLRRLSVGLNTKQYTFVDNAAFDYQLGFRRFVPYIELLPAQDPTANTFSQWTLRGIFSEQDVALFDTTGYTGNSTAVADIFELRYEWRKKSALQPLAFMAALEQQSYTSSFGEAENYLKLSLEGRCGFAYDEGRFIKMRVFFGGFLANTRREAGATSGLNTRGTFALVHQGFNDYRFDGNYVGRNANEGWAAQQVSLQEGAFKVPIGPAFGLGRSNDFITAFNLEVDLPFDIPYLPTVRPYVDFGYFSNAQPTGADDSFEDQFIYNGGLAIDLGGVVGIYLPLFSSQNLADILAQRGSYGQRIGFSLHLDRLNPFQRLRQGDF